MTLKEIEVMKRREINLIRFEDMHQNYEREREKMQEFKDKVIKKHNRLEQTLKEIDDTKRQTLDKIQRQNFEVERQVREKTSPRDIFKETRMNITMQEILSSPSKSKMKVRLRNSMPRNIRTGGGLSQFN